MTDDLVARLRALARYDHDDVGIGDEAADEIERLRGEVRNRRELHRVVAEELGANIESWPDHRNAPLAIAATFMLHKQHAEKAEAELADVKVKWMGQIGQCATLSTQIDRLEAERDAAMKVIEAAKAMRRAGTATLADCDCAFDAALAAFEKEQGR